MALFLVIDFTIRFLGASFCSPIGMFATLMVSGIKPEFKPGPPKQFASAVGFLFAFLATLFYFVIDGFDDHELVGAIIMAMLAGASGLEGFANFCLGCLFYGYGIQYGIIPSSVYRIYTASREEIIKAWDYKFLDSNAPPPTPVDTDPHNPVALKYKQKCK
jgi:hypothetical protein